MPLSIFLCIKFRGENIKKWKGKKFWLFKIKILECCSNDGFWITGCSFQQFLKGYKTTRRIIWAIMYFTAIMYQQTYKVNIEKVCRYVKLVIWRNFVWHQKTYQPYSHVHKRNNIRPDYKTFSNINQVSLDLLRYL